MPKITIEIEDSILADRVKFTMSPSFATLAKKIHNGYGLSAAEGYAIACANLVLKESKKLESPIIAKIPQVRKK